MIRSNEKQIILSTELILSASEALKLRAHLEAILNRRAVASQVIFVHRGKLALNETNFRAWELLFAVLKNPYVNLACFAFEEENSAYRFLAWELGRRAGV